MHHFPSQTEDPNIAAPANAEAAAAADLEKYLVHVAHLDLPLLAKIELIKAVRFIMQSFVDRAFGDDPVQQAMGRDKSAAKGESPRPSMLGSDANTPDIQTNLTDAFGRSSPADAEGESDRFK
jgi:hypothetical protein